MAENGDTFNGRRNVNSNYFKFPHPFWVVTITFGIWLLTMSTFVPNHIPSFLGPICWIGQYMGFNYPLICKILFIGMIIVHCFEAAYAEQFCVERGFSMSAAVKWTLQTLIFGYASLIRLKDYGNDKKYS